MNNTLLNAVKPVAQAVVNEELPVVKESLESLLAGVITRAEAKLPPELQAEAAVITPIYEAEITAAIESWTVKL